MAGHVHTTAKVVNIQDTPDNRTFTFKVAQQSVVCLRDSAQAAQRSCSPSWEQPWPRVPAIWVLDSQLHSTAFAQLLSLQGTCQ